MVEITTRLDYNVSHAPLFGTCRMEHSIRVFLAAGRGGAGAVSVPLVDLSPVAFDRHHRGRGVRAAEGDSLPARAAAGSETQTLEQFLGRVKVLARRKIAATEVKRGIWLSASCSENGVGGKTRPHPQEGLPPTLNAH